MVINTGLESLCTITDTPEEMKEAIKLAMEHSFSPDETKRREEILLRDFSNANNIKKLIQLLD
jgi:hypothetical protein